MKFWPEKSIHLLKPLKRICVLNPETMTESTNPDFEFEYIDIGNVTLEAGVVSREPMKFVDAPSRARKTVRTGDVLVSTVRTYLKAVAYIGPDAEHWVASTGFAVMRVGSQIDSRFLYRAVQSTPFIESVVALSTGVSYPAINPSTLGEILLPVPDLETQKAIADFLDREVARIDQLTEKKQRLVKLLREKRSIEIAEVMKRGLNSNIELKDTGIDWLGKVPTHWKHAYLKHLFRQTKRQGYPDLTVLSVYREYGVIVKSSRDDNINKTPDDISMYQLVNPGDLVINKMKAWQGSLGISEHHGITSPDYVVFRPTAPHHPKFVHHFLRAQPLPTVYRMTSNGIRPDQWRLEPKKFRNLPIFLPGCDEQAQISDHIDRMICQTEHLIKITESSIDRLREFRTALITAAVTGQIDVAIWGKRGDTGRRLDRIEAETPVREARA